MVWYLKPLQLSRHLGARIEVYRVRHNRHCVTAQPKIVALRGVAKPLSLPARSLRGGFVSLSSSAVLDT